MAALIREPPRRTGRRGGSRCARAPTRSTSPRSRASRAAAATARRPGFSSDASIDEITEFIRREFVARSRRCGTAPARCAGLVGRSRARSSRRDRPGRQAGRAVVVRASSRELRRRTGARTGHAGTLDPFATGLLLVLSGGRRGSRRASSGWTSATSRRSTSRARTSTGDPEGEVVERHEPAVRRSSSGGSRASAARSSCRSPPRRR